MIKKNILKKDETMCSHLVYQFRISKGKWEYHCMSEEDTCGGCCKNGNCIYITEEERAVLKRTG